MCALSLDPLKKCCINPSKEPAGGNRMCIHTFFAFHPWHCGHSGINKFEIKSIFFKEKFHLMLNAKPLLTYIYYETNTWGPFKMDHEFLHFFDLKSCPQ